MKWHPILQGASDLIAIEGRLPPRSSHSDFPWTSHVVVKELGQDLGIDVADPPECSGAIPGPIVTKPRKGHDLRLDHQFVTRFTRSFNHFVTSIVAPVASGWSGCRVGLSPTGKAPPLHGAPCGFNRSTQHIG